MIQQDEWYKSSEKRPGRFEIVWALFNGKYIELAQLSLTEKEYKKYFEGYSEKGWCSLETEKIATVTHWKPLNRPKKPGYINDSKR